MRKILVVDDDPSVLTLISEILRKEFLPIVASGGKDCISKAITENPELILLDVNMPGMDGFETCGRLRTQPSTRHIPIIMLTGERSLESMVKAMELGADDYIRKPFQPRELLARIRARLRRNESYQWVGDEV